jgi:hypothetical protein
VKQKLVVAAAFLVPLVVLGVIATIHFRSHPPPPPLAKPRAPILPDLMMSPLRDFVAGGVRGGGGQQLFFTASVGNVGPGAFIVHAVRGDERGSWRVTQRFRERDGSTTELITPGEMVWGGHGHNHWHVHLGASYTLYSLPRKKEVRDLEKVGFCFFDQKPLTGQVAAAAHIPVFGKDSCNGRHSLSLTMGISSGWQDPYTWTLPDQRLDITGLPDGTYRLVARADPDNWFKENDEKNNTTWADVRLKTSVSPPQVTVLQTAQR